MDLLIPAAGFATRMNNIPKFLLPVGRKGESLLATQVANAAEWYDTILIGVKEDLIPLMNEQLFDRRVQIVPISTKTMSETILKLAFKSTSDKLTLIMPDTFFKGENPHQFLSTANSDLNIALWLIGEKQKGKLGQIEISENKVVRSIDKDPTCELPYAWGALSFNRKFLDLINEEMPHVGYGISPAILSGLSISHSVIDGNYFDCGTPDEYYELVRLLSSSDVE
jgi:choline kinase